jgi:hypothetical protein
MVTLYKNINESSWSKYVLCVVFSKNINEQINDWEVNLDKIIFDEQIKTGSFHGQFPVDDNRRTRMQESLEKGIIRPYYGAINARACAYTLQIMPPKCVIGVEHEVINEKTFFEDTVSILQKDASVMNDDFRKGFVIEEQEYRTLQKWKNWNEKDEFTSRYIYRFFPTSIGLVIKVTDTHTKDQIDISDYDNW